MISCDRALELISRELDEALSPEEYALLREHLASCAECKALALELRDLHETMPELNAPVPVGFADSVMYRIRLEHSAAKSSRAPISRGWLKNWRIWGGMAAALILIAAGMSRLPLMRMGAADSTAAAPAALTGKTEAASTAGAVYGQAETADGREAPKAEPSAAADKYERFFAGIGQASDESAAAGTGLLPAAENSMEAAIVPVLTEEEAGYLVLESAVEESITRYERVAEGNSIVFAVESVVGDAYRLTYNGLSADGRRYEFTLLIPDGTEQKWSVSTDGGEVLRNEA